jgi:hypothetical protein
MPPSIAIINVEEGLPTLEDARARLKSELALCRCRNVQAA